MATMKQKAGKIEVTLDNGTVLFLELEKLDGYEWAAVRVLDHNKDMIAEPIHIKCAGPLVTMELRDVGGAETTLKLDADNHWTHE